MSADGRVYGGVPAAQRSAERRQRLLDAGLELLGNRGVANVTIADICAEAGLIKRYFYEQFASLDEFTDVLIDGLVDELTALMLRDAGHRGEPDWLRNRIAALVDALTADPRVARLVLVETYGATGGLARLRERIMHRSVETAISDMLSPDAIAHGSPQRVQMTAYALTGACGQLTLAWVQDELDATSDELVDYIVRLFVSTTALIAPDGA